MSSRDTNVSVAVNRTEKLRLEAIADVYESSQAGVFRHWIQENYHAMFGDIHPEALERHDVDIEALIRGDIEPEDIDDDLKVNGDGPAQVPAADGGVSAPVQPESYSPTFTPSDLETAGTELTWSELKAAVERHWNDNLAIHHDRVRSAGEVNMNGDSYSGDDYALKSNQTVVAKILSGLCRSRGDIVTRKQIEATILQYTEHQISRGDVDAGRQYKKDTYGELITQYFIEHPDPLEEKYYTSEDAFETLFPEEVEETISELLEERQFVLDPKTHTQRTGIAVRKDPTQWLEDLASFRQKIGLLHAVRENGQFATALNESDLEIDDYPIPMAAVTHVLKDTLQAYSRVNDFARFAVGDAMLELDEDTRLEATIFDDYDNEVSLRPDSPTQPIMEWVTQRETPLSPQAQIQAVAEKL